MADPLSSPPRPPVRIRCAEPQEDDWLIEQHGIVYRDQFGFDDSFRRDIEHKLTNFRARRDPFNRLYIAVVDGRPSGSTAISVRGPRSAFLNFVLVLPEARGSGLARRLLQTAVGHALHNGMAEIGLETYHCLVAARALYATLGFVRTEVHPPAAAHGQVVQREYWRLDLS
jgi:GNAT superfamily N-acetyltransferase